VGLLEYLQQRTTQMHPKGLKPNGAPCRSRLWARTAHHPRTSGRTDPGPAAQQPTRQAPSPPSHQDTPSGGAPPLERLGRGGHRRVRVGGRPSARTGVRHSDIWGTGSAGFGPTWPMAQFSRASAVPLLPDVGRHRAVSYRDSHGRGIEFPVPDRPDRRAGRDRHQKR
jgi:hypothetical protein